jgi:hypothetical protein
MDKIDNKKTLDCYQAKHISSGAHQDQSPAIREIGLMPTLGAHNSLV